MDSHHLLTQTNVNGLSQSAGLQMEEAFQKKQDSAQQTTKLLEQKVEDSTQVLMSDQSSHQQVSNQNQQAVQTSQFQSEAPLLGLCPKPVHLMTEQEKRNHLAKVRNLRSNFAGWRAGVSAEGKGDKDKDKDKEKVEIKEPTSTGLEDLI